MIVYKTTNLINKRFYIGRDSRNLPNYYGSSVSLKNDIKKYGKENFKKEIIEYCKSEKELNEREIYWIKKTKAQKLGYNIATGGTGFSPGQDNIASKTCMSKEKIMEKNLKAAKTTREKGLLKGKNHPLWNKGHGQKSRLKIKQNHADCSGKNNSRAKKWTLISPNNNVYTLFGTFDGFCKKNQLPVSTLKRHLNKGKIINAKNRNVINWEVKIGW